MTFGRREPESLHRVLEQLDDNSGKKVTHPGKGKGGLPWPLLIVSTVVLTVVLYAGMGVDLGKPFLTAPAKCDKRLGMEFMVMSGYTPVRPGMRKRMIAQYGFYISGIVIHEWPDERPGERLAALSRLCAAGTPEMPGRIPSSLSGRCTNRWSEIPSA